MDLATKSRMMIESSKTRSVILLITTSGTSFRNNEWKITCMVSQHHVKTRPEDATMIGGSVEADLDQYTIHLASSFILKRGNTTIYINADKIEQKVIYSV